MTESILIDWQLLPGCSTCNTFDLQLYIHVLKLVMTESILMTGKYVESNFRYSRKGNRRCLLCYSFVLLDCN